MAITFDAATISESTSPSDPYTFSHTVGSGSHTVLFVLIARRPGVTTVTYNGVTMTKHREENNTNAHASVWYLTNPATGTNTVSVDLAAAGMTTVLAVSFFGVDQNAPIEADNGANGASAGSSSIDVTSVTDGAWLLDTLCIRTSSGQTITQGAESGRTDWSTDWEFEPAGNGAAGGGTKYEAVSPAGAKTFSWTFSDSTRPFAHVGVAVKPALKAKPPFQCRTRFFART